MAPSADRPDYNSLSVLIMRLPLISENDEIFTRQFCTFNESQHRVHEINGMYDIAGWTWDKNKVAVGTALITSIDLWNKVQEVKA